MSAKGQKQTSQLRGALVRNWFRSCSPHYAEGAFVAGSGGHASLGMAIIGMTPASTFEKTVCGRNLTQSDSIGQITARIDLPPPKLAQV